MLNIHTVAYFHVYISSLNRCILIIIIILLSKFLLYRIKLPDGTIKEGKKWLTSPMDIAKEISVGLAASALIAQVIIFNKHLYSTSFVTCIPTVVLFSYRYHFYPRER